MSWNLEGTREFEERYGSLDADEQVALDNSIALLEEHGPALGRPHADVVHGSRFTNMKSCERKKAGIRCVPSSRLIHAAVRFS